MVYNPDTYSVSLVYLVPLHPGCHRRVGIQWSSPTGSPRVVRWEPSPAVGPGLQEHSPIPHPFPHSHYSGNSAGGCVEDPCDVESVYNGYGLVHMYRLALELHEGLYHLLSPHPFLLQQLRTPQSLCLLRCEGASWGSSSLWQSGVQIHLPRCHSS